MNNNCKNIENCNYCNYCYSCNYCNSCDSCNSCNSCYSCNYCNSCDSCNYCNYCDYCYSCNYCNSCDSCNYCNSCNYCDSCNSCNYCNSCDSCNYCNSCNSCNYCNYCDSCNSCSYCNSCDSCNYCNSCYSCNYCDFSSRLRMSERMLFCLGEGKYESKGAGYQKNNQIFNTQVTPDEWDEAKSSLPAINIAVTKWVDKKDMTKDEKSKHPVYKEIGGYLKRYSYKEAWANWWTEASQEDKQAILDLPHFDAEIFEGITGIKDIEVKAQTVNIGGTEYKVTPELTKALKDLKEA